jgi:hypothetical protein
MSGSTGLLQMRHVGRNDLRFVIECPRKNAVRCRMELIWFGFVFGMNSSVFVCYHVVQFVNEFIENVGAAFSSWILVQSQFIRWRSSGVTA